MSSKWHARSSRSVRPAQRRHRRSHHDRNRPLKCLGATLSGIAAGGVGVVALGIGIGFGLRARSLSNELSKPGTPYSPSKVDSGERANKITIAGMIGGSVLVAAGATMYWLGYTRGKHQERVTLAPMVSDQLAGLAVVGTLP